MCQLLPFSCDFHQASKMCTRIQQPALQNKLQQQREEDTIPVSLTSCPETQDTLWRGRQAIVNLPAKPCFLLPSPSPFTCKNQRVPCKPFFLFFSLPSLEDLFNSPTKAHLRTQAHLGQPLQTRVASCSWGRFSPFLAGECQAPLLLSKNLPENPPQRPLPSQGSAYIITNSVLTNYIIISQVPILLPLKGKFPKGKGQSQFFQIPPQC